MKSKKKLYPNSNFKNLNEYYNFCRTYQVFGSDALKLKERMTKLAKRLEPKLRPTKTAS